MRQTIEIRVLYVLGLGVLLSLSSTAGAAVITGRVVDGDGRPLANAEVRIWQKLPGPENQRVSDQPVRYAEGEGGDVLLTDANGRFETPDVVAPEAFARVFVDAEGMLTARGDWIEIRQENSPQDIHIVLRRLRIVTGRVLDRDGRAIDGATVFHVGDAPEKIITQTDREGKFHLPLVPEGRVFLFAEKPGYRFTGMLLTDGGDTAITLARVDEPIEPLRALAPLVPYEEELAFVREIVERAYEAAKSGTQDQKRWALLASAELDPVGTFDRAEALDFRVQPQRRFLDQRCATLCAAGRGNLSWDDLRTYIELSDDHASIAHYLCDAASRMGDDERARRLEWLDEALLQAQHEEVATRRSWALTLVAAAFAQANMHERTAEIMSEAQKGTEHSPREPRFLALALADENPRRAIEWLDGFQTATNYQYQREAGELAVRLLPEHPEMAADVWRRAHARAATREPTEFDLHGWEVANIADLCYRLATVDRARAERLALCEAFGQTRIRGLAGVALAFSQTDAAAARRLLASLIRDELPRLPSNEAEIPRLEAPSVTAAWLLSIAERIDPQLARECFWRSLALRRPRPSHDDFDDVAEEPDTELAKMLARYDRDVARALLEPMAARLPHIAAAIGTSIETRPAMFVRSYTNHKMRYILIAAALIEARWAAELVASLPPGADRFNSPVYYLAATLGPPFDERWTGEVYDGRWINYGAFGAGYWKLPVGDARKTAYHAKIR
ncbi:MAG TPA: carboxypeptidase-like regulatory domain-containing protein [Pirellulales bacterium]